MIFLGLASNYSAGRILRHLFAWGTQKDSDTLRSALAIRYGASTDQVALYHTGRSALAAALLAVAEPGSPVILPGLTCIAVIRAIKAAGCTPVYSDIDPKTLQYDFDALDKTLSVCYNGSNGSPSPASPRPDDSLYDKNIKTTAHSRPDDQKSGSKTPQTAQTTQTPQTKPAEPAKTPVILAQNTLGIPIDAEKLEKLAQKHHAIIVEDLAHSAGRFYPDGREIGTIGVATALSFGKGKAIDTICGGAVIIRQPKSQPNPQLKSQPNLQPQAQLKPQPRSDQPQPTAESLQQPTHKPRLSQRLRDRWYPVFAGLSRTFWHIGLGKAFLAACIKLRWIEKSADAELSLVTRLTHWQAKLAYRQLKTLPRTPLREHTFVKNRSHALQELKTQGYDLCETWYDTPVSPARYAAEADFPSDRCPATVKVADHILNFPTWYPSSKLAPAREIIKPYEVEL